MGIVVRPKFGPKGPNGNYKAKYSACVLWQNVVSARLLRFADSSRIIGSNTVKRCNSPFPLGMYVLLGKLSFVVLKPRLVIQ